jgi:hypothetical protein
MPERTRGFLATAVKCLRAENPALVFAAAGRSIKLTLGTIASVAKPLSKRSMLQRMAVSTHIRAGCRGDAVRRPGWAWPSPYKRL